MKTILLLLVLILGPSYFLNAAPNAPVTPAPIFRIVFKAYDGNPKKTNDYGKFSFQIDTIDLRQPSEFLQLGQTIPNTHLKLLKFAFKEVFDPRVAEGEDVSELSVVSTITGKTAVLTLNKVANVVAIEPRSAPASK